MNSKYEILEFLDQGNFGKVFRAKNIVKCLKIVQILANESCMLKKFYVFTFLQK